MAKIAAIVGWVGTALVAVAFGLRFLKPELDVYRTYTAWAGLACILVYLVAQWRESSTGASARATRMGTMSIVSIIAMLAILAALNYLGVRQNKRWDLTANQVFSLSEQTLKVLQGLDAPAKLTVYDLATGFDRIKDRLEEYTYQSKQLTVEYVDIDRQPARAKAAGVTAAGTLVLEYKGRVERITQTEEQDIANAFIKATTGQERMISSRRATARRIRPAASAMATARSPKRSRATTTASRSWCSRKPPPSPTRRRRWWSPGR